MTSKIRKGSLWLSLEKERAGAAFVSQVGACADALLPACAGNADAQDYAPAYGQAYAPLSGYLKQVQRQQHRDELKRQREERAAEALERQPHLASALYTAPLTSATDLRSTVSGNTLYMERPIVANHVLQRMETEQIYFSPDGMAQSATWAGMSWEITGDLLCLENAQHKKCLRGVQDSAKEKFFLSSDNKLAHLVRVGTGDSAHLVAQYAQYQKQKAADDKVAAAVLGGLLVGMLSGGGGGGGGSSGTQYYQNGSPGGGGGSDPGYSAPPIGGANGLYGDSHGVGSQ